MIALLTSIFVAIPILDQWLQKFISFYLAQKLASDKKEDVDSVTKMLADLNQIPVEQLLGSSTAGTPSGIEGTTIVDTLPGVK